MGMRAQLKPGNNAQPHLGVEPGHRTAAATTTRPGRRLDLAALFSRPIGSARAGGVVWPGGSGRRRGYAEEARQMREAGARSDSHACASDRAAARAMSRFGMQWELVLFYFWERPSYAVGCGSLRVPV